MSKAKGKNRGTRYTPITDYTATVLDVGDGGDETIDVTTHKHVEVEFEGMNYPLKLNAHEARKLAHGLFKAADVLDGGQLKERR